MPAAIIARMTEFQRGPTPSAERDDRAVGEISHGQHEGDGIDPSASALERQAMAWPLPTWERGVGAWRDDVLIGIEPFEPFPPVAAPATTAQLPAAVAAAREEPVAPRHRGALRELVEIGVMALLLFSLIRFVSQNYLIERESMQPTLQPGDMVLVDTLSYRFSGGPARGDVVVFHAWPQAGEKDFVKRVVAVPGDALTIREGRVEIDGVPVDEPYVSGVSTTPDTGPITLGTDAYYVLGDNRANSVDSRTYGPLPRDRVVGKAWLTYWPPATMGVIPDGGAQSPLADDQLREGPDGASDASSVEVAP